MTTVPPFLPASRVVGRDQQLDELDRIFDEVRAGNPATAIIAGEAGIGKSRLICEFADRTQTARSARVVVGHAVPTDSGGAAFTPIIGVLRALVDDLGPDSLLDLAGPGGHVLDSLVPGLGTGRGAPSSGEDDRGPLYEVLTSLLERLAAGAPLVVAIEDIHWSDAASRDLLRFVVRGLYRAPVLLLMSYRSDELHRGHPVRPWLAELERVPSVHRLDIPRLDQAAVNAQLTELWGRTPSMSEAGSVFRRSEGVPFFVEELASTSTTNGVPSTIADLVLARVESLHPDTQRVVRAVSAYGRGVRHELVDAVTSGMDVRSLDDALREAVSASVLVVQDDHYVFRHALLREAVHHDMLPGERARTHAAYATVLESRPDLAAQDRCASEVAYHWTQARDDARAFGWSLEAIDELAEVYAFGSALEAAERAIDLWDRVHDPQGVSGGDLIDLLTRAARLATEAGELARTLSLIKAAVTALDPEDLERRGVLTAMRGETQMQVGMIEATETLERAWELTAEHGSPETRAVIADGRSIMLMLTGRIEQAMAWADEARVLAEKAGNEPLMSSAHNTLGCCLFHLNDSDRATEQFDLAHRLSGDHPRSLLRYHANYSDALMLRRRYADAVEIAIAGKVRARELGRKRKQGSFLAGNAAEPLIALGEWDRAEGLVNRALELDPPHVHVSHLWLLQAQLALWRGEVARAEQTVGLLDASGFTPTVQIARPRARVGASIALAQDDPDTAWQVARAALPVDHEDLLPAYDLPLAAVAARALAARARAGHEIRAEADDLGRAVAAMDRTMPRTPWPVLVAAELTPPGDARAVDAWQSAAVRLDEADVEAVLRPYSRVRLARAQLDAGERASAADTLTEARVGADALGAGLLVTWIEDLARRGRLPTASGPPAEPTFGLTGRELEVLGLVADGRSNREVGADLHISTKTASVHVSNILAKLGVSSRGAAAAVAHRRGLLDKES